MRIAFQVVSWVALAATIVPSMVYYADHMKLEQAQTVMLIATLAWFVATPLWMGRDAPAHAEDAKQVQ